MWEAIRGISLDSFREDTIRWRWTKDGEYTTKSAYRIQFEGAFSEMRIMPIWKAKADPKCRFFAWTLLHKKIQMADNLSKRNWQHDPICKLCGIEHETPTHLCKDCPFTKEVWDLLKQWLGLSILNNIGIFGSLYKFWRKCSMKIEKTQRRKFDGIMIYFWWNMWNERNKRTFQQQSLQPRQVALLCKDDNNYSWRLLVQRGFSRLEVSVFPGSQLSFGLVLMCFLLIVVFFSCSYCGWVPWFLVLFSG
jgi:hypothetical protein